jgi:Flp pilus assembly protein TadD
MKLGNLQTAANHFLKGRELQPRSAPLAVDAGFALLKLNRLDEAEKAAADAVALEPQNTAARLLLDRIRAQR